MPETVLPDGRTAQLWLGGAAEGPVVLVCHGTPDTRWVARTGAAAAEAAGARLLCVNRPGYGTSSPAPSTPASVADDAVAVLDDLGLGSVAVLGMSVGGLYAVALAARHPDRVATLGLVATPEPGSVAPGPDVRAELERWTAGIAPADPDDEALARRWLAALSERDAALLAGLGTAGVAASAREALAGPEGYLRDVAVLGAEPDDVTGIRRPAYLWYGEDDDRNPPSAGEWWAGRIPGARLVVRPGTTHLATLLASWPEILATLVNNH